MQLHCGTVCMHVADWLLHTLVWCCREHIIMHLNISAQMQLQATRPSGWRCQSRNINMHYQCSGRSTALCNLTWLDVARFLGILWICWEDAGVVTLLDDDERQLGQRIEAELQQATTLCQKLRARGSQVIGRSISKWCADAVCAMNDITQYSKALQGNCKN